MAKHDENKDLRLFSRIGRVKTASKTLIASKGAVIGIRMWGRIDYLTHYCGYTLIWDNAVVPGNSQDDVKVSSKKSKKNSDVDKPRKPNKRKQYEK